MKKILMLMLALVLFLTLVACSNSSSGAGSSSNSQSGSGSISEQGTPENNMAKDEMVQNAEITDVNEITDAIKENQVVAMEELPGKICLFDGYINGIESDHIILRIIDESNVEITVPLPIDDIKNIVNRQCISVVGTLESPGESKISLKDCYIVKDTYEFTGEVTFYYTTLYDNGHPIDRTGEEDAWYLALTEQVMSKTELNTYYTHRIVSLADVVPVNHVKGQPVESITIDGAELKNGDIITITGKARYGNLSSPVNDIGKSMMDVKLVSVNSDEADNAPSST